MGRVIAGAVLITFVILFFHDSDLSRKIWIAMTAVVSFISAGAIPIIYVQAKGYIAGLKAEEKLKTDLVSNYNQFFIMISVLLIIYAVFKLIAYWRQNKRKDAENIDFYIESAVVFISAAFAALIIIIWIMFSKVLSPADYKMYIYHESVVTAANIVIIVNTFLYMKLTQ